MANLYENLPAEQAQALANEQKRRIAEAMMAQGLEAETPYTSAGRYVVPMSWSQGLNKVAQAMLGAYGVRKSQQAQDALAQQVQDKGNQAVKQYQDSQSQSWVGSAPSISEDGSGTPGSVNMSPTPEQLTASRRQNLISFLTNPYAPEGARQGAVLTENWARQDEESAANREYLKQKADEDRQARLDIAAQLSEDRRYTADSNAETRRVVAAAAAGNKNTQYLPTDQGIFQVGPGGQLTPVMAPGGGSQLRPQAAANYDKGLAARLHQQYMTNPNVQLALTLEPRVKTVADYYLKRDQASDEAKAVGDLNLVKAYITATRPDGTRAEGMTATEIAKLPGLPGRVQAAIANFALGKHLPDDIAAELMRTVRDTYKNADVGRKQARQETVSRARASNIDESYVFGNEDGD